jgi:hypothetical protein
MKTNLEKRHEVDDLDDDELDLDDDELDGLDLEDQLEVLLDRAFGKTTAQ